MQGNRLKFRFTRISMLLLLLFAVGLVFLFSGGTGQTDDMIRQGSAFGLLVGFGFLFGMMTPRPNTDAGNNRSQGQWRPLRDSLTLAVDSRGHIYVLPKKSARVIHADSEGASVEGIEQFYSAQTESLTPFIFDVELDGTLHIRQPDSQQAFTVSPDGKIDTVDFSLSARFG